MLEYRILIQEHLDNGANYMHNFPLAKCCLEEALAFMKEEYHSDCVFVLQYSLN